MRRTLFLEKFGYLPRLASTSVLALCIPLAAGTADYTQFSVEGNAFIADSVVLGAAGLTQGKAASDTELNQAVQNLYNSGWFKSVDIVPQGSNATIRVQENAVISEVFYEGNKKIKDEDLAAIVTLGPRQGLDQAKIEDAAQSIRRVYAGKSQFDVEVRPVVIPVRENLYKLVFEIDEGPTSEIERVSFVGNRAVSDWRLRREVESNEAGWLSPIFSRDNFETTRLKTDREKLEDYYADHGYYNATITGAEANYDAAGNYYLSYAIEEGPKYKIASTKITSEVPGISPADFEQFTKKTRKGYYSRSKLRDVIDDIEHEAEFRGHPFLRVTPDITVDEVNKTLHINYRLVQAEKQYVERIDVRGNEATIDRVVRRQFETVEGDPLNDREIDEATGRILGSGFFSNAAVNIREGSAPDQKIIDVDVDEAETGSLMFGGAYSSDFGFSIFGTLEERNFLGRGQTLKVMMDLGQEVQTFSVDFLEPGLFNRDVAGGIGLNFTNEENESAAYQTTKREFDPSLSFDVSEDSRVQLRYFLSGNEIRDVEDYASPLVKAEEDYVLTSGLGASWTWDETNSYTDPTRGWIVRLGDDFAGLGGDAEWNRVYGKAKYFHPLLEDIRFTTSLEGGSIESLNDDSVRISERYFIGGTRSLRGFDYGGLGPRDYTDTVNSNLGGKYYAVAKADITFPIGLPEELGFRGGLFTDYGSVWGLDDTTGSAMPYVDDSLIWRGSYGAAIYWDLGAQDLAFFWANPYKAEEYDELQSFAVSITTRF